MGAIHEGDCPFCADNARKRREQIELRLGDGSPELIVPLRRAPDGSLGLAGTDTKGG